MSSVKNIRSFLHRAMDRFWLSIQVLLFIIICLTLSETHLFGGQQIAVGEITHIEGHAFVRRVGGKFESAQVRQNLYEGDAVKTGQGSQATILCSDGSKMNLKENTLLILKGVPQKYKQKTLMKTKKGSGTYKKGSLVGGPSKIRMFKWSDRSDPEWASGPPEIKSFKSSDPELKKIYNNEQNDKELKKELIEKKREKMREKIENEKEKERT